MAETRKTFALKLIAFLKREIEEKLISDRLKDADLREAISLWSEPPGPIQPIVIVEVALRCRNQPLLAVSFERMDEELAEFELVEDEEVKSSRSSPKHFAGDTIRSNMPTHPLVSRSLLTDADIEIRVCEKAHSELKELSRRLYKHKADAMIDIFLYTLPNLEDIIRQYAVDKLNAELSAYRPLSEPKTDAADICEALLQDLSSPQPPKRKPSCEPSPVTRGDAGLLQQAIALSRLAEDRVLASFLAVKPRNAATLQIDAMCAEADDQLTDSIKLAALAAKHAWALARDDTEVLKTEADIRPDDAQPAQTWRFVGRRPRTEPLAW
jgi:hypothetical protein